MKTNAATSFYTFSGAHSLLIGLLPFFLPVLLWQRGFSLSWIAVFIALTALSYIATLWVWDRLRLRQQWRRIICLSFVMELLLVVGIVTSEHFSALLALAILNGAYSCFFWATQRTLFHALSAQGNTGNTFGNLQVISVVLLKLGVLLGGFLLQSAADSWLIVTSLVVALAALALLLSLSDQLGADTVVGHENIPEPSVSVSGVFQFRDRHYSRTTFFLDGPFLFLESYCWILSLYFLSQQNVMQLGLTVVILTATLSLVFWLIKGRIDAANQQWVFPLAVVLYALSWVLRSTLDADTPESILYPLILVITFFTSFFRLAFNKRFFDLARQERAHRYIVCKSYYSQFGMVVFFALVALLWSTGTEPQQSLALLYWLASPLALGFCLYGGAHVHLLSNWTKNGVTGSLLGNKY